MRSGEARGSAADNGDARGLRPDGLDVRLVRLGGNVLDDETLERAHSDRLSAGHAGAATLLARVVADARADGRQRIGLPNDAVRISVLAARDVGHVAPDLRSHGASVLTGRTHQLPATACRTTPLVHVGLVFVAEPAQRAENRVRGSLAQAAKACVLDRLSQFLKVHDPLHAQKGVRLVLPVPGPGNGLEDFEHPLGALAAGDAFAAALVLDELHEELRHVHHAGAVVHDHEPARPDDGAERLERFVVNLRVDLRSRYAPAGRAAHLRRLEGPASRHAAADLLDDPAKRRAERHLHQAGVVDASDEGEDLCALGLLAPDARKPLGAAIDDVADVGPGLDVVDVRGLAEKAVLRGEGGPRPRHAAFALDAVDQGRLLAAHESARALLHHDVEVEPAVQDVAAQQAVFLRLPDGPVQLLDRLRILGPAIDVGLLGADRIGADDHPLDNEMRIALDLGAVHVGARVPLVGIADHVLLMARLFAAELPLEAGREARPASAAQPGLLHGLDDVRRRHGVERLCERGVAAVKDVVVKGGRVEVAVLGQDHARLLRVERDLLLVHDPLPTGRVHVKKTLHDAVIPDGLLYQFVGVFRLHANVEDVLRADDDHRPLRAEAVATRHLDLNGVVKTVFGYRGSQGVNQSDRALGVAARVAAHRDTQFVWVVSCDKFLPIIL